MKRSYRTRTLWKRVFCWIIQIGFALILASFAKCAKIDGLPRNLHDATQDTVFINFPHRANSTRAVARHMYLPPEEPDFALPEVIDNRVRNSLIKPTTIPAGLLPLEFGLKTPYQSDGSYYVPTGLTLPTNVPDHNGKLQKNFEHTALVKINTMSCRNAQDQVFFKASVVPLRHLNHPIIVGAGSEACRMEKVNEEYRLDFSNELFWNCGVQDCSTELGRFYCLNLRFPAIPGLLLKEDTKILLRCRTQEKTTSHIKRINLKTLDTSARMAPRIATGGHKNAFETEVGLYRKALGSEYLFDAKIQPGGTVILGEEILLRVVVRDGDGWKYSRISDVTVHYVENKRQKKVMNSLWILDSNGCLNSEVREICSREQYRVSSLETYLIFEAFMFENMKETDEMVMSVKVTGCLEGADCILNCPSGHVRKSRSLENPQNQTINSLDDISFRVVFPGKNYYRSSNNHMIVLYILFSFILIAIAFTLCTINMLQKRRKVQRF